MKVIKNILVVLILSFFLSGCFTLPSFDEIAIERTSVSLPSSQTIIENEISIEHNLDSSYLNSINNISLIMKSTHPIDVSVTGAGWKEVETNFPEIIVEDLINICEKNKISINSIILNGLDLNEESKIQDLINENKTEYILQVELIEIKMLVDYSIGKTYAISILDIINKKTVFKANISIERMPAYGEGGLNNESASELVDQLFQKLEPLLKK